MSKQQPPPAYTPHEEYASPYSPRGPPPPLPPRISQQYTAPPPPPPPPPPARPSRPSSTSYFSNSSLEPLEPSQSMQLLQDPRSSSQASLLPDDSEPWSQRRTLLLVYIHGFMGNETSFQSFPAHLHNLLTVTLGGTDGEDGYRVHTKVYPKFKTRHQINVATLEFSTWLNAFESDSTDIVLLGHSMGGLLAAEVILLHSLYSPEARRHPNIIGLIAFDTPYLGMHPGIISAGLASLFRPAPPPPGASPGTPGEDGDIDPFYAQAPKRNFTVVASKKPANPWESTLHFISKYHNNLTQATGNYLMSHLEFNACLADPVGLSQRYNKIRQLEDGVQLQNGGTDRVRFCNYYTISYGRDKPEKPEKTSEHAAAAAADEDASPGLVEAGIAAQMAQLAMVGAGEALEPVVTAGGHHEPLGTEEPNKPHSKPHLDPSGEEQKKTHIRSTSGSSLGSMHSIPPTAEEYFDAFEDTPAYASPNHPVFELAAGSSYHHPAPEYHAPTLEPKHNDQHPPALEVESKHNDQHPPALEVEPPTPISAPPDDLESLFPPISAPPAEPVLQEVTDSVEKHLRKALQSENKRLQKEYERQMKEYGKLVKAREKTISKIRKDRAKEQAAKGDADGDTERARKSEQEGKDREREAHERELKDQEADKQRQEQIKFRQDEEKEKAKQKQEQIKFRQDEEKEKAKQKQELEKEAKKEAKNLAKKNKPPRQRKFCITPSKPDSAWTPVEMKGVDEVGAHCGLFFVSETYEKLVGDVAGRIEEWVGEEQSKRLVNMSAASPGYGNEKGQGYGNERSPGYGQDKSREAGYMYMPPPDNGGYGYDGGNHYGDNGGGGNHYGGNGGGGHNHSSGGDGGGDGGFGG